MSPTLAPTPPPLPSPTQTVLVNLPPDVVKHLSPHVSGPTAAWATIIAAGIAVCGAVIAFLGVAWQVRTAANNAREERKADAAALTRKLNHEIAATREHREQERREQAYISLLKYMNWLRLFVAMNFEVFDRELKAVNDVRAADGVLNVGSAAEQVALDAAGPTDHEEEDMTGPSVKERAETVALVTALASDEVRTEFDAVHRRKTDAIEQVTKARAALRGKARPEPSTGKPAQAPAQEAGDAGQTTDEMEQASDEETQIAIRAMESAFDLLGASMPIFGVLNKFKDEVEKLEETIRAELQSTRAVAARSDGSPDASLA